MLLSSIYLQYYTKVDAVVPFLTHLQAKKMINFHIILEAGIYM